MLRLALFLLGEAHADACGVRALGGAGASVAEAQRLLRAAVQPWEPPGTTCRPVVEAATRRGQRAGYG